MFPSYLELSSRAKRRRFIDGTCSIPDFVRMRTISAMFRESMTEKNN